MSKTDRKIRTLTFVVKDVDGQEYSTSIYIELGVDYPISALTLQLHMAIRSAMDTLLNGPTSDVDPAERKARLDRVDLLLSGAGR